MPQYEIKRWDPVLPEGNDHPMPMIYIKPDEKFLEYAKENNYMVVVTVNDSGTIYDGKSMGGIIDSSGYFPNFRPNFFNEKGYLTITMFAHWYGYPVNRNNLGNVSIRGLKGEDKIELKPQPYKVPKPVQEMYEDVGKEDKNNKCTNLSGKQLGWVMTGILIMFCVLLVISVKKK